ncbi:M15 family metallopeptidase [Paludibaculum fermentans]|uniref:M15 family metallopeptidase n=1 Tax=Paludibaculum fermentans TaxID=1473598 RepID=UPI003EB73E57
MNSALIWVALLQAAAFFRIEPVRPVAELRAQAQGLKPPAEAGQFLETDLAELTALDSTVHLDIRYASNRNFLATPIYTQARAFLQRPAAEGLVRAHRRLNQAGYGILVHDGYRPWWVTWVFWEATPAAQHDFVADPAKGSRHNRGCAADITLYDLKTGAAVEMPSLYDEMSERAYPDYPGGTAEQRRLRGLLRDAMEKEGFQVYEYEWWHFDYKDWRRYRVANVNFEAIPRQAR